MRIPFDSLVLAAVVDEAQPFVGGKVQRIWQPDEYTIVLGIYARGEGLFLLSCHPQFSRAHFITRKPTNVEPLPGLAQALRARVDGATITGISQIGFDRILQIDFESREGGHRLTAELMGKHSNLMLVDAEGRVIAAAKWIGPSKSVRPIQPGRPYAPPPFEPRPSVLEAAPGEDLKGMEGASPFLLKLIAAVGLEEVQRIARERDFAPVIVPQSGAYPMSVASLGMAEHHRNAISIALEQHYDWAMREAQASALRESLLAQLKRVMLARDVALRDLREAADTAARAGSLQLNGELILAYGPTLPEGSAILEAEDYEGKPLTIRLDPTKSYLENAQAYFGKAKKAKAGHGTVRDQIVRLSEDREALEAAIAEISEAREVEHLQLLQKRARERRWLHQQPSAAAARRKEDRPYEGHRIRELLGPGGVVVLYGENAESNDYLTLRVAKPNDWWLHVRGHNSAHVVIPTRNQPDRIGREALMFAAKVAVQNSTLKHSGYVPVDYTLKKHVRRPRGAAKGTVLYTHEKTLHVES